MTSSNELDIDRLRADHQLIHYFGLGFVQLKMTPLHRLHFYTPELPAIVSLEDIHDHRYDFLSTVLKGTLCQEWFTKVPGDSHVMEEESCQSGVENHGQPEPCGIKSMGSFKLVAGSHYQISHDTFHVAWAEGECVTSIHRTDYTKPLARVIRPVGELKVCPFSQKVPESRLWEIVEKIIRSP